MKLFNKGINLVLKRNALLKLAISIIFASIINIIYIQYDFYSFSFWNEINIYLYLFVSIVIFSLLMVINNNKLDKILLFLLSLIYSILAVIKYNNIYFAIGTSLILSFIFYYSFKDKIKINIRVKHLKLYLIIICILFVLFTGILTSLQYLMNYSSCFDFGIFSQMFTYLKDTFLPYTTCERDILLSHFAVHFSPILYVILPFYYLFPSPITLLIGQGIIIASGIIPLYLILRNHNYDDKNIAIISTLYILFPTLISACFYFFHENCFLTPLILWLIYFLEKKNLKMIVISTFLLMFVKEDAPIYVSFLGLYFFISKKNIKDGILIFLVSIIYFTITTYLLSQYGYWIVQNTSGRYSNYFYDGSNSLITIIKSILLNPIFIIKECFTKEKLIYLIKMLMPISFMPLFIKNKANIILLFPLILFNLMSMYGYQYNIDFQYSFGTTSFLFYLLILNYKDIKNKNKNIILYFAIIFSIIFFFSINYKRIETIKAYNLSKENINTIDSYINKIPEDSSVTATTFLIPKLYKFKELFELETTSNFTDYVVLSKSNMYDKEYLNKYSDYSIYYKVDNIILILKKD